MAAGLRKTLARLPGRRLIALGAVVFGVVLAGWGLWAVVLGVSSGEPMLPGGTVAHVTDQGLVALMGAGLAWLGALRLWMKKTEHD